jgi:3-methyl-2-oxobutanoate hydroxymethyltransferase
MTPTEKAAALAARKGGIPLSALTAYDYPSARLIDACGIDILLVGDSLGMVVLGFPDTTHVTIEHMCHHTAAVARAHPQALVLGDMPIDTYNSPEQAVRHAIMLRDAGAEAVKLEGGFDQVANITAILGAGIPVIGHIGMLPQQIVSEGAYRKKGRTEADAQRLIHDALALCEAGVCAMVLESVVPDVAARITAAVNVPTIGIGCGIGTCDGEVAVLTDLLGSFPWFVPPFAKPEAHLAATISSAVLAYKRRVETQAP